MNIIRRVCDSGSISKRYHDYLHVHTYLLNAIVHNYGKRSTNDPKLCNSDNNVVDV